MTPEDYRKMRQAEAERQSKMSYKELFVLNGKTAAVKSLIFVVVAYFGFKYLFDVTFSGLGMGILFLFDVSYNTFRHKWFAFLRK